jgi:hypothetical protein
MRWSEQQLADHLAKTGVAAASRPISTSDRPFAAPDAKKRMQALGRLKTGEMNKTEAAYFAHLQRLLFAGEIQWFKFEGVKLRLADNTFYTCDFAVLAADASLERALRRAFIGVRAAVCREVETSFKDSIWDPVLRVWPDPGGCNRAQG